MVSDKNDVIEALKFLGISPERLITFHTFNDLERNIRKTRFCLLDKCLVDESNKGSLVQEINQQLDESDEDLGWIVSDKWGQTYWMGQYFLESKPHSVSCFKAWKHPHVLLTAPRKLIFFVQTKDA